MACSDLAYSGCNINAALEASVKIKVISTGVHQTPDKL